MAKSGYLKIPSLPLLALLCLCSSAFGETPVRERLDFNADWRFHKGDAPGSEELGYARLKPWLLPAGKAFLYQGLAPSLRPAGEAPGEGNAHVQPGFDDSSWRPLTLPHDWGVEGPFDQELPGENAKLPWFGVAWYRKTFALPAADAGRRIYLEIDGAMAYAAVWCNGRFVGGWPYGYSSFRLDLTPFVKPGASNTLAVRLDNPKDSSRWYPGGGLYRNVWLLKTSPVAVAQWGTQAVTSEVGESSAKVNLSVAISNDGAVDAEVSATTRFYRLLPGADGRCERVLAAEAESATASVCAGKRCLVEQVATLEKPALWSLETPNRYVAVTELYQAGKRVDAYETVFGVRTIQFTKDRGFLLNGRRVWLRGVCEHHDFGALGTAFNLRAAERKLQLLKEMGVNAMRTSHNPPAPELLDLCDRLGIVVMDEFVDSWKLWRKPNDYNLLFEDWAEKDLRALVRRDRNHPCVILWSIGNEVIEQSKPEGPALAKMLSGYVHAEDSTRPTTVAVSDAKGGYNGFQTGVDVFGYNYKPREYAKFRAANPEIPLFGSETSSTVSSRGEYLFPVTTNKDGGMLGNFQVSSYDLYAPRWATTADDEFKGQDQNPFVAGEFIWTGFDYLGEPTPFNKDLSNLLNYHTPEEKAKAEAELNALGKIRVPSRSSYFGAFDLAGFKKDRFYLYQARWRPELPMAHILPHWSWPERLGELTPVHVYTSGDEAELFLNGKSLGRKRRGSYEYRLCWNETKYRPGELRVVAYKEGKLWAEDVVRTSGPAAKVELSVDRANVKADGADLAYVTARVLDAKGLFVPRAHNELRFEVSGPAELLATDNGDPTSFVPFQSAKRATFNGLALAILRTKAGQSGVVTVKAFSDGLETGRISFETK